MAEPLLEVVIRTPEEEVVKLEAHSLRVPADTGQVGLRPGCEPAVLALEPGLMLAWTTGGVRFLATAGGLLRCTGQRVTALTPLAVAGDDARDVRERLDRALAAPRADLQLRRAIERLETGILRELRKGDAASASEARP